MTLLLAADRHDYPGSGRLSERSCRAYSLFIANGSLHWYSAADSHPWRLTAGIYSTSATFAVEHRLAQVVR